MSYFAPQAAIQYFLNLYRTFGPGGIVPTVVSSNAITENGIAITENGIAITES